jgi:hypothetical protein
VSKFLEIPRIWKGNKGQKWVRIDCKYLATIETILG